MTIKQTGSQTVGPFFAFGLFRDGNEHILVNDQTRGQHILLTGMVFDGDQQPILDSMIEIWQADAQGIFNHPEDPRREKADPAFRGFGRSQSIDGGKFTFKTIKPGPVPYEGEMMQAPHVNVRIVARGMLIHAVTRLYFSDEPANEKDPVLNAIANPARRQTLIATLQDSNDLPTYCFNIHLQGDNETVFFNP
jgi:protocatechuate 3,4-dioxygenase alpha subunit